MKQFFKPAVMRSNRLNLIRTLYQAGLFWVIFLVILPFLIFYLEKHIDKIPYFNGSIIWGSLFFIIFGILNLCSGITMSLSGKGTPLPLESPRELVIKGPYRFIRNPMALGGIGQAISIGIVLGSYSIIVYALLGAFLWHYVVRPIEEEDLVDRFGDQYICYQQRVGLWIPKVYDE